MTTSTKMPISKQAPPKIKSAANEPINELRKAFIGGHGMRVERFLQSKANFL
jgi:hypothetical protein